MSYEPARQLELSDHHLGRARAASPSSPKPARGPASTRPLIVTDEGLDRRADDQEGAGRSSRMRRCSAPSRGNPALSHVEAGLARVPRRRPRRRRGLRRRLGARCRQGRRLHVGTDAARSGISRTSATGGPGRIRPASRRWLRCRPRRAPARKSAAPASSSIEETHQKKIIFHPQMMPRIVISDAGTDRRPAARRDRGHRHRRVRALLRGILRPGIPSAGRRRRARGHAAHPSLPAARLRGRQGHRGARADAGRRIDGRHGVSERSRRRARHRAPRGLVVQHPSRADQCRHSSLRHDLQPARHRR